MADPPAANGKTGGETTSGEADGGIQIETHLSRDLGLVSALAIGVGTMIAAGIFTLSGLAVSAVGSAAIVAFLLAALVATFTALTYCEFASIYPESGEGYLYARKTFAPPLAYTVGWCLLLGYTASCGFYIASLSTYFNEFIVPASLHPYFHDYPQIANVPGLLALAGLVLLNIKGTKESGSFQIVVTAAKVILLIIFVGGGMLTFKSDTPTKLWDRFSDSSQSAEIPADTQSAEALGIAVDSESDTPLEITAITPGSAAESLGMKAGETIVQVGTTPVSTLAELDAALAAGPPDVLKPGDAFFITRTRPNTALLIGSTAALVFITFFGFSAIAASAGEVQDPTKTIPRAIFISMILVTILYTAVVLVMVAAELTEYSESAMGVAAKMFLGSFGGMVIVGGAIFSMISASNASIMAGSRVAMSMAKLGHLPKEIGSVNARTHTPIISVVLVGMGIGTFVIFLPLESLAHFADCVLLLVLILVNAALIYHRKKFPDIERPFRVPLVPVLPILGILANIYLLAQLPIQGHVGILALASFSILCGFFGYLAWKGAQVEEGDLPGKPSRVALARPSAAEQAKFRVLVPIANPANVEELVDLAASVAKQRGGEIVALRVVVIPEQIAPSIEEAHVERERRLLEVARSHAIAAGVHISTLVRVGHYPARAILETSREWGCDLIVLGWKGHTSTARRILGEVTDDVVRYARADIMLVKLSGKEGPLRRVLLPSAGGEHAIRAQDYAVNMAASIEGSQLTLCSVVDPEDEARAKSETERLEKAKGRIEGVESISTELIKHRSVAAGIIKAAEKHDAVIIGAAGQSFSSQIMFGSIPESVARLAKCTVIVVKRYHAVKALVGRVMSE